MRFVFNLLAMMAVALAVGFGLSYYALTDGRLFGAYEVGPWAAWPRCRLAVARSLYPRLSRAHRLAAARRQRGPAVRRHAPTATASPLDRACRYRIEGTTPVASFWTLVPTDTDGTDIARPDGPPAFHSSRIARAEDGSMILYVSRSICAAELARDLRRRPFELVLTLYDTLDLRGRRLRGRGPARDHPRGLPVIRLLLWLFGGVLLGAIIHIGGHPLLPCFAEQRRLDQASPRSMRSSGSSCSRRSSPAQPNPLRLDPEMTYAVCQLDLRKGPGVVSGVLPQAFWSVAVYNRTGTVIYSTTNRDGLGPASTSASSTRRRPGCSPSSSSISRRAC